MNQARLSRIIFLLPVLFALLFPACPGGFVKNPREKQTVIETMNSIKEEEITQARREFLLSHLFKEFGQWLADYRIYVRTFFIAAGCFVLLCIIFLITNFIFKRRYDRRHREEIACAFGETDFDANRLGELEKQNDFSRAVLYLYRHTIVWLVGQKIIASRNLTDYSIASRIAEIPLKKAFNLIAFLSERILFDNFQATRRDYTECRRAFSVYFITLEERT